MAIIPSKAGNYILPAIEIPWWNTSTDRLETASLPARKIKVMPADNVRPELSSISPPSEKPIPNSKKTPLVQPESYWIWISLILAIGWLATIIVWWRVARHSNTNMEEQTNVLTTKNVLKQLKHACQRNDSNQAKEALLAWAKTHWQQHAPCSLGEIGNRCGDLFQTEIRQLNQILYSHTEKSWQGSELWKAFKQYIAQSGNSEKSIMEELEPLYKPAN